MAKNKKVKMEDDCGGIKPIKMLPPKQGTTKKKVKLTKKQYFLILWQRILECQSRKRKQQKKYQKRNSSYTRV